MQTPGSRRPVLFGQLWPFPWGARASRPDRPGCIRMNFLQTIVCMKLGNLRLASQENKNPMEIPDKPRASPRPPAVGHHVLMVGRTGEGQGVRACSPAGTVLITLRRDGLSDRRPWGFSPRTLISKFLLAQILSEKLLAAQYEAAFRKEGNARSLSFVLSGREVRLRARKREQPENRSMAKFKSHADRRAAMVPIVRTMRQQGKSFSEISKRTGVPRATIASWIARRNFGIPAVGP